MLLKHIDFNCHIFLSNQFHLHRYNIYFTHFLAQTMPKNNSKNSGENGDDQLLIVRLWHDLPSKPTKNFLTKIAPSGLGALLFQRKPDSHYHSRRVIFHFLQKNKNLESFWKNISQEILFSRTFTGNH